MFLYVQTNTFQGIVITDGATTFAVFTYKCMDLNWARVPLVIGFSAAGDFFENHDFTGSVDAHLLDCHNQPASDYVNVIYNITTINSTKSPISPDTSMFINEFLY